MIDLGGKATLGANTFTGAQVINANGTVFSVADTTAAGGASPLFDLYRNVTAANANDLAQFNFTGNSTLGTKRTFGTMRGRVFIATDGSEVGGTIFSGLNGSGVQADVLALTGQSGVIAPKFAFAATVAGSLLSNIGVSGNNTFWQERQNGTTVLTIYGAVSTANGDLGIGAGSALATTATGGFPLFPSCAGAPTGVPGNNGAGKVPMIYDTTNNKIWFYNGSWRGVVVA